MFDLSVPMAIKIESYKTIIFIACMLLSSISMMSYLYWKKLFVDEVVYCIICSIVVGAGVGGFSTLPSIAVLYQKIELNKYGEVKAYAKSFPDNIGVQLLREKLIKTGSITYIDVVYLKDNVNKQLEIEKVKNVFDQDSVAKNNIPNVETKSIAYFDKE